MALSEHASLADVKDHLSEVVERVEREHGRVVITKHGRPSVVLLSVEDLESLEETLEILSDPQLTAAVRAAEADVAAGRRLPPPLTSVSIGFPGAGGVGCEGSLV